MARPAYRHHCASRQGEKLLLWVPRRLFFLHRALTFSRQFQIAREEFPIPKLPPPRPVELPQTDDQGRLISPIASSSPPQPSSQEADKENAPATAASAAAAEPPEVQELEPGQLPKQLDDMLTAITSHLESFPAYPPHTIQRLAELVLRPRAHYKALAPYLHAVDRVIMVTSGADTYPLPPPIVGGISGEENYPASSVAWSNPTNSTLGTDDALGGALLTPIPWVTSNKLPTADPLVSGDSASHPDTQAQAGAQIHSESTEKIDGPNGMGSVETVSVSVNGIPSTGRARGITQGELLRQEQRAGLVPVNPLRSTRELSAAEAAAMAGRRAAAGAAEEEEEDEETAAAGGERRSPGHGDDDREQERAGGSAEREDEEEETPHARGPEEIGVGDTGLQTATTSHLGEGGGLETGGIDVEAAVGRKHHEEGEGEEGTAQKTEEGDEPVSSPSGSDGVGVKRDAETGLEGDAAKKLKEDAEDPRSEDKDEGGGDRMETDK